MYDIAIIGAGVVGVMIARELSKYNLSICILDKESDVSMGASKANSGIIHAGYDAKCGSLKAILNVKGSKMMKQITEELSVKYKNNGSLVIGYTDEDMSAISELYDRGVKNGVEGLEVIDKMKLKQLEPNISQNAIGALFAPTGAIVCPYELTVAAIGNAMDNGAALKLEFEVKSINLLNDYYEISSHKETMKAKYIINAAGLYADEVARMAGDDSFEIHPRKGEYLILDKEFGNLTKHTIFRVPSKMGKGILVSATVDGNLLLGPTSEDILDKEDKSTTQIGMSKVIHGALDNVPDIPLKSVITSFSGLRAVADRGDFIIEKSKTNFINIAGIESPGLSASPAIALYVVELLGEMGVSLTPKTNFKPNRKIFAADKSKYGKIICRCEHISEYEIVKAIHTNPPATNVDAVKRRTRSGMGRCQGGFCMPHVVEILARELNINFEEVTKFGGNSKITIGKTKGIS